LEHVGRYQILDELGRGAHGVVYKALDPAIGRTIAIKAIPIGETSTADLDRVRAGILREARLAGTLSHPNIVAVYDVVDAIDEAFIVMEFVDGKSLEKAIAAGLSRAAFLSVLRQVAQALDYAHRKGIVHRDVKPANIVLTDHRAGETGELLAKMADFGVAKISSHEKTQPLGAKSRPVGTPNYMSPEQVAGVTLTGASDQFSLAVIAYEVLTGQKAFTADSLEALLYKIRHEPETPVDTLNPSLSPTVAKVMRRALAKNPEDRFHSCAEFAGALEFALGDSPPVIIQEPAPQYVTYQEESSGWLKKIALLLVLCVFAALALVLMVRMNSGSAVPVQVLDTKTAPVSPPPPAVTELKTDDTPTIVKVPDLPALPKKKPAVRQTGTSEPPASLPSHRDVQLLTDPPGATVTADGTQSCTTPCSLALAPGRHTLAASLPGFSIARKIFSVPQDLNILLPLEKSVGILLVSSDPAGATVNVDGQSAGRAPLTLRLAPGIHRLTLSEGGRRREETIQVTPDQVTTRLFRF